MKEMIASACYRILAAVVGGALAFGAGADVPLPQGYTRLEWIQSDGSQYIDTLYTHQPNSRVVASFAVSAPQKSSWAAVFGSRDSDCNNAFLFSVCSGKNTPLKPFYARNLNADGARGVVDLPDGVRVNLECDGLTAHWEAAADPAIADTIALNGSTSAGSRTMTLFGCRHETTPNDKVFYIAMKLFAFDIYEGDVAKRKFVPCCSLEGKVGLWDLVEGRFYGDAANSAKRFRCSDDQD